MAADADPAAPAPEAPPWQEESREIAIWLRCNRLVLRDNYEVYGWQFFDQGNKTVACHDDGTEIVFRNDECLAEEDRTKDVCPDNDYLICGGYDDYVTGDDEDDTGEIGPEGDAGEGDALSAQLRRLQKETREARKKSEADLAAKRESWERGQQLFEQMLKRGEEQLAESRKRYDELCAMLARREASWSSPARTQPVTPSPPTRSPVTFADLLPGVGKTNRVQLDQVVRELVGPGSPAGLVFEESFRARPEVAENILRSDGVEHCCPPGPGGIVGTEERRFRRPPDPGCGGSNMRRFDSRGRRRADGVLAGTEERGFRVAPDGGRDPAVRRWTRVVVSSRRGGAGTSVLGFRIPPDGGVWKTGLASRKKRSVAAGTEERAFRRPPDRVQHLDRMLAVFAGF